MQVQQSCTHAEKICSLLTGRPARGLPNTEKSFGDLQTRIEKTIAFLKTFTPQQIDGTENKIIDFSGRVLPARILLLSRVLPHFYFHCTTAYDILRHCGVPLGKHDFLGAPLALLDDAEGLKSWSFSR